MNIRPATEVGPLIITPIGGRDYRYAADQFILLADGTRIIVKKGFTTDLESGPDWVKDFILSPNTYRQAAAGPHDAFYRSGMPKALADLMYVQILLGAGVDKEDADRLYEGVHLFGNTSWEMDQRELQQKLAAQQHLEVVFPS